MARRNNIIASVDWLTILVWILMITFGWMNIYSANIMNGDGSILDFSQRYGKQFIWIGVALLLIILIFILDAKFFAFFAYPLYGLLILTLMAVLVLGKEINGARSWFVIGSFQFQPSEFAKPFTALALARLLSSHGFILNRFKSLLTAGSIIFLPALFIALQPDMGSTLVYFAFILVLYREGFSQNIMILGAALVVLFVATLLMDKAILILIVWLLSLILLKIAYGSNKEILKIAIAGAAAFGLLMALSYLLDLQLSIFKNALIAFAISLGSILLSALKARNKSWIKVLAGMVVAVLFVISVDYAMNNLLKEHQQQRIYVTLGMDDDPQGVGYNVNQSKIAIGSGGFSGKGFLKGTQTKLQFVPEQSTDFIFCTVGEEWGFLGTLIVVILFVFLIVRLVILAERQRSHFSRIYGYGLVSVLMIHFIVNIGMTIGLFPVIGIPLPFFSYGGSSMLAFSLFLFIFLKLDSNRMDLLR